MNLPSFSSSTMENTVSQHLRDMGASIIDLMMLHRARSSILHETVQRFQFFTDELRARTEVMNDRIRDMEPLVHCLHNGMNVAMQNPSLDLRGLMGEVHDASARVIKASQDVQDIIDAFQAQDNRSQGVQGGEPFAEHNPQTPPGRGLSIP